MKSLITIIFSLFLLSGFSEAFVRVSGTVKDKSTGEYLIGVTVVEEATRIGTITNEYGFFTLRLTPGTVKINFSMVGYETEVVELDLESNKELQVELSVGILLDEFVVSANSFREQVRSTQMSVARLSAKEARLIPTLLGESDILKSLQLKPGIQSGGEGQSGLSVRGGQPDQNLFLLDEAVLYNPLHLFGFFSAFNTDAVKEANLYKGDFPAQFGGRLSSVIDIRTNEGNRREFKVKGGLGLISSRLTVEGPIVNDRSSFIIGGRRTYADVFTRMINNANSDNENFNPIPDYFFYDFNAGINYDINSKNKLFFTGYLGQDRFGFSNDNFNAAFDWGNTALSLRWNSILSPMMFLNTSITYSHYQYDLSNSFQNFSFGLGSGISDLTAKSDFSFFPCDKHQIRFGFLATRHWFEIGRLSINTTDNSFDYESGQNLDASQLAIYINDDWKINDRLNLNSGLRLSGFINNGSFFNILEPRLSARYLISDDISVKGGYTYMAQYLHLVGNSGASLPTDIWYPSEAAVKPQRMQQVAAGFTWNINNSLLLTNEIFYKWGINQVDFRDGAQLFANDNLAEEFVFGKANSYGNEIYLEKRLGKLKGWIGYTLMWSWRQFDDINQGNRFPSRFDRRHDLSVVAMWDVSRSWAISSTLVYSTGNAVSLPVGRTFLQGTEAGDFAVVPIFTDRNAFRMPDYLRLDLNVSYKWKTKSGEHDLTFSLFNATNRRNPFFIYFDEERSDQDLLLGFTAKQVSLFPVIPAITWNFSF